MAALRFAMFLRSLHNSRHVDNVAVPMMARQSLQIAESVEGLRLTPQAGGTIYGRLRMEANSNSMPDPSQMFLLLRSSDSDSDGDNDSLSSITMGISFSNVAHGQWRWQLCVEECARRKLCRPDFRGQRYAGLVSKIRDRGRP